VWRSSNLKNVEFQITSTWYNIYFWLKYLKILRNIMGTGFTVYRFLERGDLELVLQEKLRLCWVAYIQHHIEQTDICIGPVNNLLRYLHVFITLSEHLTFNDMYHQAIKWPQFQFVLNFLFGVEIPRLLHEDQSHFKPILTLRLHYIYCCIRLKHIYIYI
jgi:hypothetical protein